MAFINGNFPGKFIVIDVTKATSKHLEALNEVYPTAFFITNRSEINEIKSIKLITNTNIEDVEKNFGKKVDIDYETAKIFQRNQIFTLEKYEAINVSNISIGNFNNYQTVL